MCAEDVAQFYSNFYDLLGFYCRASMVYIIMLLTLILTPRFSSPLLEESAVGLRIQLHTE